MDYGRALKSGTLIADVWRVERVLGEGGFGVTYEVHNTKTREHAALKEYMPAGCCNRALQSSHVTASAGREGEVFRWGLERFMKEAETLARLEHPSIVRVAGSFEANGTAYMALAYETGGTFKDWLARIGRRPTQAEIDDLLRPLLDALTQVHSLFLLHRDIKPDNIMLRADGTPVLIDFGAARSAVAGHTRALGGVNPAATSAFAVVADGYSPPEQYDPSGRMMGPASDVYALGATLYTALAGDRPPSASSRHFSDDYQPLGTRLAGSAYRVEFLAAVDRALSVHPKDRPQSAMEFRRALQIPDAVSHRVEAMPAPKPTETAAPVVHQIAQSPITFSKLPSAPLPAAKPRSRASMMVTGVLAAAAASVGGWWMLAQRPELKTPVETAAVSDAGAGDLKARAVAALRDAERRRAEEEKERERAAAAREADAAKRKAEEEAPAKAAATEAERKAKEEAQRKAAAENAERERVARQQIEEDARAKAAAATRQAADEKPITIPPGPLTPRDAPQARLLRRFAVPGIYLTHFAFSPDGKTGVSGGCQAKKNCDPSMRLWDMATGRQIGSFSDSFTSVQSLSFAADGRYILAGNFDGTVAFWDVRTRKWVASSSEYGTWQSGEFSPDGKFVAAVNYQGKVRILSMPALKLVREIPAEGNLTSVVFSPDSKFVVSGNSTINKWEVATGKLVWSAKPQHGRALLNNTPYAPTIYAFAYASDGKAILSGDANGFVRVSDAADGSEIKLVNAHSGSIHKLSLSPDGRHFATGSTAECYFDPTKAERTFSNFICPKNGSVKIWSTETGQLLAEITDIQKDGRPYFSADGRSLMVIGNDTSDLPTDRAMVLWDVSDFVK